MLEANLELSNLYQHMMPYDQFERVAWLIVSVWLKDCRDDITRWFGRNKLCENGWLCKIEIKIFRVYLPIAWTAPIWKCGIIEKKVLSFQVGTKFCLQNELLFTKHGWSTCWSEQIGQLGPILSTLFELSKSLLWIIHDAQTLQTSTGEN